MISRKSEWMRMQGDQEEEERRRRRKLVLCIIYSIMILGAIISLPFLVMVVGSSSSKVVNNNNQNQSGHLSPSTLEMVYKREVTGNGHQHQERLKARFTPRMKEQTSSNDPELNTISNHHHHQQQSFSSLSPSSSSLETTFINEQSSPTLLSLPSSSLQSAPLQLSSSSLPSLTSLTSSSLHHSPRRRRRKKKRIRTESNEEEIESNTESTYNMNTNLIEDNTYLNLTTISFLPITSSPSPLLSSSSLSLSSLSSPISSSSSQSNVNEDYIIKSINQNKRTSSSIQVNTKMNKLFTAKYYYLYNRCSGGKVQIMGTRKVSASAPLLPSSTSGQSQSIPSSSLSSSSFSNSSPFPHHSRHRRHHSLLYTLHHQEQVPVSFSTSGDLLDDDYGKRKICVYTNITFLLVTFFNLFSSRLVPVFLPYLLSLFFLDTFLSLSLVVSLSLRLIIPLPLVWNIPVYLSVAFTLHTCFYFPSFWVHFILCVSCTRRREGKTWQILPSRSQTLFLTFSPSLSSFWIVTSLLLQRDWVRGEREMSGRNSRGRWGGNSYTHSYSWLLYYVSTVQVPVMFDDEMILSKGSGFVTTSSSSHLSPSSLSDFLSFSHSFFLWFTQIFFRSLRTSFPLQIQDYIQDIYILFDRGIIIIIIPIFALTHLSPFPCSIINLSLYLRRENNFCAKWVIERMDDKLEGNGMREDGRKNEILTRTWEEVEARKIFRYFFFETRPWRKGVHFIHSFFFLPLSHSPSLSLPHSFCCSFCTNCLCIQTNISIYSRSTINRNKSGRNNWVQTGVKG